MKHNRQYSEPRKTDSQFRDLFTTAALVLLTAVILFVSSGSMVNNFAKHWSDKNTGMEGKL